MADSLANFKKLLSTIMNNLPWAFLVAMVFALVLILAQVYKLKEAYETGVAIQNECGDEFLERERGDYKVHNIYKTEVKDTLAVSFQILTGLVAFTGAAVIIMHGNVIFNNYEFGDSQKTIMPFDIQWKLFSYGWVQRATHILILLVTMYITANWFATTFSKADNFKIGGTSLSPLKVSLKNKASMYAAQVTQLAALAAITGIAVISPMYNTSIQDKFSPEVKNLLWIFTGVFIVAAAVIPTVSYVILRIRGPVDEYETNYSGLNVDTDNLTQDQEIALKRNIYHTNPADGMPDDLPTDENELRSYITHNVNYSDLQAIQIPEQLRPYIHYSSLKGEAVLQLKRDLVAFYNDKNNTKYDVNLTNKKASAPAEHANSTQPNINKYDSSLRNTLFRHFTSEYRNLLLKVTGLSADDNEKKNNLFDTLNEYVITNTSLEKANPFSSATLTKLRQMRENTSIKDSVQSIFSVTSGIIFTTLAIILLFIFRYMYSNVPNAGTWISGLVIIILLLGTSAGFLVKDTWL